MRAKELIKQLQKCDPDLYVYLYGAYSSRLEEINYVDISMDDRVDLNVDDSYFNSGFYTEIKRNKGETNKKQNERQEDDQVYWC